MNVQYVHAALGARRAWPSFSCRCVSTGEACQTPGSPFQRCQRTFQVLSGAGRENKGGENKGGRGREGCLWLAPGPWKTGHEKNDRKQWILSSAHSVFRTKAASIDTTEICCGTAVDSRAGKRYLQSGSVHVSRQFSSPSTGYHEHFIGVHLQRETRVSAHVTPACWCELSVNTSFSKHMIKIFGIFFSFFFFTVLPVTEGTLGGRAGAWPGMRCVLQVLKGGSGGCRALHCAHFFGGDTCSRLGKGRTWNHFCTIGVIQCKLKTEHLRYGPSKSTQERLSRK